MNWTDFLFGVIAGSSFALLCGAFFIYRLIRPYLHAASRAAKAPGRAAPSHMTWPPFSTPPEGNP